MTTTAHVPVGLLGCTVGQRWMSVSQVPVRTMAHVKMRSMATLARVKQSSR